MARPLFRHPGPAAARLEIAVPDETEPVQEIAVQRWLAQMQADVVDTLGGIMLRAARPVPLTVVGISTQLSGSPGRLVGWSLHETTGANPFLVRFRNGGDTGADIISIAGGGNGGVDNRWFGPSGISFTEGLFVEVLSGGGLSGQVEGTLYIGAAD